MRSLSSVVKSAHVIMDNKKFVLSSKITMPEIPLDDPRLLEREGQKKQTNEEMIASAYEESKQIIERAMEEAQTHINAARNEAEKIISDGMDQSKEIMDRSRQEGYYDGQQQGFEEGRQVAQALINDALEIKQNAVETYKQLVNDAEPEIVELVLEICSKILNKALEADDYILGLIQSALSKCTYTTNVVLRVSDDDYEYVAHEKNKILSMCQNVDDIEIKIDRSLSRGACLLESPAGMIDAGIQVQLDYIRNRFEEILMSE